MAERARELEREQDSALAPGNKRKSRLNINPSERGPTGDLPRTTRPSEGRPRFIATAPNGAIRVRSGAGKAEPRKGPGLPGEPGTSILVVGPEGLRKGNGSEKVFDLCEVLADSQSVAVIPIGIGFYWASDFGTECAPLQTGGCSGKPSLTHYPSNQSDGEPTNRFRSRGGGAHAVTPDSGQRESLSVAAGHACELR